MCLVGAATTPLPPLLSSYRPHLVGYSVCTGEHRHLLALNRRLKRDFDFISIFGGPHPTLFPEMAAEEGVDMICRGEGDGAILELAEALSASRPFTEIPNLWVNSEGGLIRNPLRPLLTDLDALPFPDRAVRYESDPRSRDYPVKSFLVSRGCPFRCTYCFNAGFAALYGEGWCRPRERSVGSVLAEIAEVRRTSRLEFIQFRESVFPWREQWLEQFAARYTAEVGLPFYAHVRADLLTTRRVELLAQAGCVSVNLGIECGDEDYRRERLGRPMSNARIIAGCRLLKERGIRILADNMLGLPGAGLELDKKTLQLNRQCGVDYPLAMIFQPYPGTQLGDWARDQGLFSGDLDQIETNYYLESPLEFAAPSHKRQTENLQKFFALLVEAPWLERMIRPLLALPANVVYLSIFKAWYMYCYTRRIIPHRLDRTDLLELLGSLFGFYGREVNHELVQEG